MIRGKNPTLLNVTYVRPSKKDDQKECFQVIYKTEDGEVHYSEEPPAADIYIVKPEFRNYIYNKPQERMERMEKVRCKISEIQKTIAKASGAWGQNIMEQAYNTKNFRQLDQLFRWPYCYACDFQPEYFFMNNWYEKYQLKRPLLSK